MEKKEDLEWIEIESVEVPEDRLTLMNDIFLHEFDDKKFIIFHSAIKREGHAKNIEDYFYKFLYALYFEYFKYPEEDLVIICKKLLKQWRRALINGKMPVIIKLPAEGIKKSDNNEIFNNIFEIEEYYHRIARIGFTGLLSDFLGTTTFISFKTELSINIYQSEVLMEFLSEEDYKKYKEEFKTKVDDLFLFPCALYLHGIEFKWQSPIIVLPWWFEPENIHAKLFNQNIYESKELTKDIFNKSISTYLKIKQCELYRHDGILLCSYFKFFQHEVVNTYFFIDAFTYFEGMFTKGSKSYIKLRLRLNSSSLFAKSISEFWELANFFGILYDIRSIAVHGENWKNMFENYIREDEKNLDKEVFNEKIRKFRIKLIYYMNKSLLDLIEKLINQPDILTDIKNDPLYYFNNSNFVNTKPNRQVILNEMENNYKTQRIKYSNKWEEFIKLFRL